MCGRWQSDATEFTVGMNYVEGRGYQSTIPKPVVDLLGLEGRITFKVSGGNVMVVQGAGHAEAERGPPSGRPDRTGPSESTPPSPGVRRGSRRRRRRRGGQGRPRTG